jgi:hypothetical protein
MPHRRRLSAPRRVDLVMQPDVAAELLLRELERLDALVRSVDQHVANRNCVRQRHAAQRQPRGERLPAQRSAASAR